MSPKVNTTYTCEICNGLNSVVRLHCKYCGVTPRCYSIVRKPVIIKVASARENCSFGSYTPVAVAKGYSRLDTMRHARVMLRTVPMDYYASSKE